MYTFNFKKHKPLLSSSGKKVLPKKNKQISAYKNIVHFHTQKMKLIL